MNHNRMPGNTDTGATSGTVSDKFISSVIKWVKLDDRCRELAKELKEVRDQKKGMEDDILSMMTQQEQEVLNLSTGGSLRRSVSKCKGGLKEDYIRQILNSFTKNMDEAVVITEAILKNRPVQERTYLKRCLPKKKK